MSLIYSHSYEDPDTGQIVDVMVPDDDDADEHRNAAPWDRRRPVGRRPVPWLPQRPGMPPQSRPQAGMPRPQAGIPRPPQPSPSYPAPGPTGPVIARQPSRPHACQHSGEHLSIRKAAVIELIPTIGQVWASFLGRPAAPKATGDDVIDRDNASMHRDALARHQQNQTRILALTDLAARALRLVTE